MTNWILFVITPAAAVIAGAFGLAAQQRKINYWCGPVEMTITLKTLRENAAAVANKARISLNR